VGAEPKPSDTDPKAAEPKATVPAPSQPAPPKVEPEQDPRKKKKLPAPVAEEFGEEDDSGAYTAVQDEPTHQYRIADIQDDMNEIMSEFIKDQFKKNGKFDVARFIKGKPQMDSDEYGSNVSYTLEIPADVFESVLDLKDLQLAIHNQLRSYAGVGQQYTQGSADIQRVGRLIIITIHKKMSWDV
jgi:hypothetical protein